MFRTPVITGWLLACAMLVLCGGCASQAKCGEHQHEFGGRCVCDYGYFLVASTCIPTGASSDGDADDTDTMDTPDIVSDTVDEEDSPDRNDTPEQAEPETVEMAHTGTCVDPQPLELDVPVLADPATAGNHILYPCNMLDLGVDWDGPDQVFTFTFGYDMLQQSSRFTVTVQPGDDTFMLYTVYLTYDTSGWGVDVCDFVDTSYCIAQRGSGQPTDAAATIPFGEPDIDTRLGGTVFIVVDTAEDESNPPGPYTVVVKQVLCEPGTLRCARDESAVERCSQQREWVTEESCENGLLCTDTGGELQCADTAAAPAP